MTNVRSLYLLAGAAALCSCRRLRPHATQIAWKPWKNSASSRRDQKADPPYKHRIVVRAAIGSARRHTAWEGDGRDP